METSIVSGNGTALLALDLQRDFLQVTGRMPVGLENAERVIAVANRVIAHAANSGWELVLIKTEFLRTDWIGNFFRRGAALAGAPGAEIDPRIIVPARHTVVAKAASDAFSNPALAEMLHRANIGRVVVLGLMAEGCVRATVKGARGRGFAVTVVSDGVGSARDFLHRFGLTSARRVGAHLTTSAELLAPGPGPQR